MPRPRITGEQVPRPVGGIGLAPREGNKTTTLYPIPRDSLGCDLISWGSWGGSQ